MDKNGVKVTIIETQFVISDAASFKSVVQSLTGKSAGAGVGAAPDRPLHRPRPCRAADGRISTAGVDAAVGILQGYYVSSSAGPSLGAAADGTLGGAVGRAAAAPPRLEGLHEICDFSELLYAGAGEWRHGGGSYNDFPN